MIVAVDPDSQALSKANGARLTGEPRVHFGYLDGIRGLAALYVLVEHVQLTALGVIDTQSLPSEGGRFLQHFSRILNSAVMGFGHAAVDVFIVLSGFCLMLPVAQSADHTLRGGIGGYLKRRAIRILPPYFAVLALILLVEFIVAGVHRFSLAQILSHFLLIHNLTRDWIYSVSAPMWSVAVEWQIYFVFALVLLPIWRRLGPVATILIACFMGLLPLYMLPAESNLGWSCPWYIGLFAFGMIAAASCPGPHSRRIFASPRWWTFLAIVFSIVTALLYLRQDSLSTREHWGPLLREAQRASGWPLDVTAGLAISCMFLSLACSRYVARPGLNGWILDFLNSEPISRLATFSYSLYLINAPIMGALLWALTLTHLGFITEFFIVWLTGIPLGLAGGYLLYLTVERHCMRAKRISSNASTSKPKFSESNSAAFQPKPA